MTSQVLSAFVRPRSSDEFAETLVERVIEPALGAEALDEPPASDVEGTPGGSVASKRR